MQGVGFRVSLARVVRSWGAAGWVRNCPDGAVEAVFEGKADAVESLLRWCHDGPRGARIERVDVRSEAPEGLTAFEIR